MKHSFAIYTAFLLLLVMTLVAMVDTIILAQVLTGVGLAVSDRVKTIAWDRHWLDDYVRVDGYQVCGQTDGMKAFNSKWWKCVDVGLVYEYTTVELKPDNYCFRVTAYNIEKDSGQRNQLPIWDDDVPEICFEIKD